MGKQQLLAFIIAKGNERKKASLANCQFQTRDWTNTRRVCDNIDQQISQLEQAREKYRTEIQDGQRKAAAEREEVKGSDDRTAIAVRDLDNEKKSNKGSQQFKANCN